MGGGKDAVKLLNAVLKEEFGGEGGEKAIDLKRPLGLYADWPEGRNEPDMPVFFVPVHDAKAGARLLRALRALRADPDKNGQDIVEVAFADEDLFARVVGDHVFLCHRRESLTQPAKLKAPPLPAGAALVQVSFFVSRVPRGVKDKVRKEFLKGFEQDEGRQPGESEEEHRERLLALASQKAFFDALVQETESLNFTLDLDRKKPLLSAELSLAPRPGGRLAESVKRFGAGRSQFAGLHRGAALSFSAHLPLGKLFADLGGLARNMVGELERVVDPRERLVLRRLLRAVEPTLREPALDVAAAAYVDQPGATAPVLGALRVKQARRLEHLVRDAIKDLSADERAFYAVQWNHATHGGTKVHAAVMPNEARNQALLFFAFRGESVLASPDLLTIKEALDRLGRPAGEDIPPVYAQADFKAVMAPVLFVHMLMTNPKAAERLAEGVLKGDREGLVPEVIRLMTSPEHQKVLARLKETVPDTTDPKLRIQVGLSGDDRLRLRLDVHPRFAALAGLLLSDFPGQKGARRPRGGVPDVKGKPVPGGGQ
jgi:hypothetical protein